MVTVHDAAFGFSGETSSAASPGPGKARPRRLKRVRRLCAQRRAGTSRPRACGHCPRAWRGLPAAPRLDSRPTRWTAVLGGHVDVCLACGHNSPSYNSCRNRHCPKCQSLAQARWIEGRMARVLPIHYFHGVFTLPAELRPLAAYNRAKVGRRAHSGLGSTKGARSIRSTRRPGRC